MKNEMVAQLRDETEKNSTASQPKMWGNDAVKGDIFIVRDYDAYNNSYRFVAGDLLEAKFTDKAAVYCWDGKHGYPNCGKSNEYWSFVKSAWTNISSLEISLENGELNGSIFGNGNHRIGVIVSFLPTNESNDAINLGDSIVNDTKIELIDYQTLRPLPQGWKVWNEKGEFHTLPSRQQSSMASEQLRRHKIYYLSCEKDEPNREVKIGCRITLPNGTCYYSSAHSDDGFLGSIKVTAHEAIAYVMSKLNYTGEYVYQCKEWNCYNYYLSIQDPSYHIVRVDITGCPPGPRPWSSISHDNTPNVHYVWPFGSPGSAKLLGAGGNSANIEALNIVVNYNQKPRALCLSRLYAKTYSCYEYDNWYYEARFDLYDQYGNSGHFSICRHEPNWGDSIWIMDGDHTSKSDV